MFIQVQKQDFFIDIKNKSNGITHKKRGKFILKKVPKETDHETTTSEKCL